MTLTTTEESELAIDAYLRGRPTAGPDAQFVGASNRHLVGSPGSARNVITVGSYDFSDTMEYESETVKVPIYIGPELKKATLLAGRASSYSPAGPLRGSGSVKPELLAPGQYHIVPRIAAFRIKDPDKRTYRDLLDDSQQYTTTNGTSAAAAYTAGVAALLLEKKPTLTAAEFRELLKKHLTKDEFTDDLPNPLWGYGKLDKAAVERLLDAVSK